MKNAKIPTRLSLLVLSLLVLGACSQTGDFGRVRQTPASMFDRAPGQDAQGGFRIIQTDEEKQMDRATHRFVSTIDGESWLSAIRLTANALAGAYPDESDYYQWLRVQPFATSAGRYAKLLSEVDADFNTLPAAFASICAVQKTDRRRAIAASSLPTTSQESLAGLEQRRLENNQKIAEFVAVVGFRYDSYSYALEQLLVETPHDSARLVDNKLSSLAVQTQAAKANQFC